jgi:hypothetical protein
MRKRRQKEKNCGEYDFADKIQQTKERENTRLPEALIYFPLHSIILTLQ